MPDCDYCGESFADEDAYLSHLAADHEEGELGAIDRRRVAGHQGDSEGSGLPVGPILLAALLAFAGAIVVYVTFSLGGGGGQGSCSTHCHGTINVTIDGTEIDFSQQRYQLQADRFHFEAGNGEIWHTHASGVTLGEAMSTLGIDVSENTVTFQGTTYRDGDEGTEVVVEAAGEPVDPESYVLQGVSNPDNVDQADHVRIVVRTNGSG